jgi:hypothetical protein
MALGGIAPEVNADGVEFRGNLRRSLEKKPFANISKLFQAVL